MTSGVCDLFAASLCINGYLLIFTDLLKNDCSSRSETL